MDKQDNFKSASNMAALIRLTVKKYRFTIKILSPRGQLSLHPQKTT